MAVGVTVQGDGLCRNPGSVARKARRVADLARRHIVATRVVSESHGVYDLFYITDCRLFAQVPPDTCVVTSLELAPLDVCGKEGQIDL